MSLDTNAVLGLIWLGLIGAALTYYLWFRGIAKLGPESITGLGFLSPLSAVLLGWLLLGQDLSLLQSSGAVIVLASVWASNRANSPGRKMAGPQLRPQPVSP